MRLKKIIDDLFRFGILAKAFFGVIEIFGGILFIFSKKIIKNNIFIYMAQDEVSSDPDDMIANFLIKTSNAIYQDSRIFAIAYLLFHGAVNVFLAVSLAKGKVKTYPAVAGLLVVFIVYQIYRFFTGYSISVLLLTLFDIFFVLVILLEYGKHKK